MDKPSTSTNSPKPKTAPKSQLIVFSPDVLKKLGIASQISKLTKASTSRISATTTTTTSTTDQSININTEKKLQNISLENEIKQQLSQTLNNAIKLKTNKNVEEKSGKNVIITSDNDLQLTLDTEIASNSSEIYLNSENSNTNQINPNESNNLLLKNSVFNETLIRKSGRKRKISSILENYVTKLNDRKETTGKYVKIPENKQKLSGTNLKNERCVDSIKTLEQDDVYKISLEAKSDNGNDDEEKKEETQFEKNSEIDRSKKNTKKILSSKETQNTKIKNKDNTGKNKTDEDKHFFKDDNKNFSPLEMSEKVKIENNQLQNDEKTENIREKESATCSANDFQTSIVTIESINNVVENKVVVDHCIETKIVNNQLQNDEKTENIRKEESATCLANECQISTATIKSINNVAENEIVVDYCIKTKIENNRLQNDEKTENIRKEESATCSANPFQTSTATIKSINNIAENKVIVEQCIETKKMDLNDKSEDLSNFASEGKESVNNIEEKIRNDPVLKVKPSVDDTKVSLVNEMDSLKTIKVSPEIQNTKNAEKLVDAEMNLKTVDVNDDANSKLQLDLKSLDPKVAELLKPLKRGRPKGRKIRSSGPLFVKINAATNEAAIVENEEVKIKVEEESCIDVPARRRSGRQRKENKLEDAVYYDDSPSISISTRIKEELVANEDTPGKKKRGRPRKQQPQQVQETVEEAITPRRVGRPSRSIPLNNNDDEEEDDIILKSGGKKKINVIESDDDEEKKEEVEEVKQSGRGKKRGRGESGSAKWQSKMVECGVCNEKIPNTTWPYHCGKHNYLCWRVGEEPIDLDNRKLCESILLKVAIAKKVTFTCSKCGEKRKSAVGYLSHIDFCQKTEEERLAMRVPCPECHKLLQPCSLKIHMRNHMHESSKVHSVVAEDDNNDGGGRNSSALEGGRTKRNAAKKAQCLINKFTNDDEEYQPVEKEIKCLYKNGSDSGRKMFRQRKYLRVFEGSLKRRKGEESMTCPIHKCPYIGSNLKMLKAHIETCSQLGVKDFLCFACWFITQDEPEMKKHVLESHLDIVNSTDQDQEFLSNGGAVSPSDEHSDIDIDIDDEQEQEPEYDDELLMKKRKKKSSIVRVNSDHGGRSCVDRVKFLANEVRVSASRNCTYPAAGKWATEFCQRNYCLKNLFAEFCVATKNNWRRVPSVEHDKYLPPTRKSISVKSVLTSKTLPDLQGEEHDDWKEFQLFETELSHDTLTIFCGGPVWELAWLPTPLNLIVDQILAVSIQREFNETFKTSESYASQQIIQFWNLGKLHFKHPLASIKEKPKLEFCLVHEHGNVWCMEWCPSGCYDDDGDADCRRMGLLALACSDGIIPIYSIPFPQINNNDDEHKIFKPIESCRLIMQDDVEMKLGNWNYQCTKLNWSKIKGHDKIAAGYSNGMVCLWDLDMVGSKNEGPLLKSVDDNGTVVLKPYFSFQPHTAAITALHFYYPLMERDNSTIRWLFTGSWDRNSCLWDLEEASTPVFVFAKRGNVSDGATISHWLCSFISFDDVHFIEHTTTSIQNVRDFGFKNSSLLSANSMVMGLSASDWANAVAQVTLAGELCCTFQRQLLLGYDVDKGSRCKRFLLSYCETIDKHLNPKKRKEKFEIKSKEKQAAANASIPENFDNSFFRYLVSKKEIDNDDHDDDDDEPEPDTYEQVCNKYGIIFCDIPLDDYDKIPPETLKMVKTSCKMKDAATEMYPILAQNRVRWNPNKQAYIYICSGYHSGFVRLRCVRFMHSKLLTLIK